MQPAPTRRRAGPTFAITALLSLGGTAFAQTPPSGDVSLDDILTWADAHAPSLAVANARRRIGEAETADAALLLRDNPTLEVQAGPRFDGSGQRDVDYTVALSQPVELSGARGKRREAARHLTARIEADTDDARATLHREVALAWRMATVHAARARLAASSLDFAQELLQTTQRRFSAGDASGIDVRLAESDAALAQQASLVADEEALLARLHLAQLAGWPVEQPPATPSTFAAPPSPPALDEALKAADQHNPRLRALRAAVDEAHARAALAAREAWPTPTLGVSLTREGAIGGAPNHIVSAMLSLPIPLWQRNQGERGRRDADKAVTRAEAEAERQLMTAALAQAHARLATATRRLSLFAAAVAPRLEDNLALLRRGFEAGELPLSDVSLARERFLRAQADALDARADCARAIFDFEAAVGAPLPLEVSP